VKGVGPDTQPKVDTCQLAMIVSHITIKASILPPRKRWILRISPSTTLLVIRRHPRPQINEGPRRSSRAGISVAGVARDILCGAVSGPRRPCRWGPSQFGN